MNHNPLAGAFVAPEHDGHFWTLARILHTPREIIEQIGAVLVVAGADDIGDVGQKGRTITTIVGLDGEPAPEIQHIWVRRGARIKDNTLVLLPFSFLIHQVPRPICFCLSPT